MLKDYTDLLTIIINFIIVYLLLCLGDNIKELLDKQPKTKVGPPTPLFTHWDTMTEEQSNNMAYEQGLYDFFHGFSESPHTYNERLNRQWQLGYNDADYIKNRAHQRSSKI